MSAARPDPIACLHPHLPGIARRAPEADRACRPAEACLQAMRDAGLLIAPLPRDLGGAGAGTEPHGAATILELLRLLGEASPALGRLFEAHVNVVRLVVRHGTQGQRARLAAGAHGGQIWGLWVTDAPGHGLVCRDGTVWGRKGPCSGAGLLRHALVTVDLGGGDTRMALLDLRGGEPVEPLGERLLGMRGAAQGTVTLDGLRLVADDLVGGAGEYLREPDFSTGAWRGSAVALGALEALVEATRRQLVRRGHDAAPAQRARFGAMLIGLGTARLWTQQAARIAEQEEGPAADQVAAVNLARIAVELACLETMREAQRALGLAALVRPNPVERLLRDLTTYLRQPAPDETLAEAARHALRPA